MDIKFFKKELRKNTGVNQILVTQGASGVDIYRSKRAGVALLSVTSLSYVKDTPVEIIGWVANITWAWSVTFTGNEKNLDFGILSRYLKSIFS